MLLAYGRTCAELALAVSNGDTAGAATLRWRAQQLFVRVLRFVPKHPAPTTGPAAAEPVAIAPQGSRRGIEDVAAAASLRRS